MSLPKTCLGCGCEFTPPKRSQKYHSKRCQKQAANIRKRRLPVDRRCRQCDAEFDSPRNRLFCSTDCRSIWWAAERQSRKWQGVDRQATCPICGTEFFLNRNDKTCCSKLCAYKHYHRRQQDAKPPRAPIACAGCKTLFTPKNTQHKCCSPECGKQVWDTNYRQSRRARLRGVETDGVDLAELYYRDKGICQHCKKRVDLRWNFPHPGSASHDHIIPLRKGGSDTLHNSQLAHLGCNMSKGARTLPDGEQLRIVG